MVCGWQDGGRGGEVLQAGHGEEGEEWGSAELGSAELGSVEFGSVEFIEYGGSGERMREGGGLKREQRR